MDRAYTAVNNTNDKKDAKTISSSAGTTGVLFVATEDLGGGLKVGASIATDWAEAGGLTQDGASSTYAAGTAGGNIPAAGGSFGNAQSFLFIEDAKLGTLRLGNVNNEVLTATTGVGAPFSTGVGSAYSSSWSVHNGYGSGATNRNNQVVNGAASATNGGVRGIRQVNTVKYVSPKIMNAVTVSLGQALKNDNGATVGAASETSTVGVTDMSIRYQAGPLDVMYASLKYDVGSNSAPLNGSLTAGSTNTHTITAITYTVMPTLKLHAGSGNSKASDTALANSSSTQFGATYTMGAFDIMAQTAKVDNKNTTAYDRKMTGLGVNYNFSKTTRAYVRYDNLKLNDGAATAVAGDSIKRTAIGVSQSF
jgi:predicted porin